MNGEQLKKSIEAICDDSNDDSLWTMARDFYSVKMLPVVFVVWGFFLVLLVPTVYSCIQFFQTSDTRDQIMHAAIFVCCMQFIALMKIFAWQMIHKNSLRRHIKRLELRIAELQASGK